MSRFFSLGEFFGELVSPLSCLLSHMYALWQIPQYLVWSIHLQAGHCIHAQPPSSISCLPAQRQCWLLCNDPCMCGKGIGFGDHCAYIYTAEMAPPKWRGRLNTLVQLGTISGIVVANAINIATNSLLWGWRLSLGLAAVPGLVLVLGKLFLCVLLHLVLDVGCHHLSRVLIKPFAGTIL